MVVAKQKVAKADKKDEQQHSGSMAHF